MINIIRFAFQDCLGPADAFVASRSGGSLTGFFQQSSTTAEKPVSVRLQTLVATALVKETFLFYDEGRGQSLN
jgi:hypothetical protein